MAKIFSSLRHRNFRLFWFGQLFSMSGIWIQTIAQGWLVLELTNSAFLLGMINAINAAPVMLFSLLGGVVADRISKRRIILTTQALSMFLAFCLGILVSLKLAQFWNIAVVVALLGVVNSFDVPARQAFVVELVGREDLNNAIALNSFLFNAARIIGPVAAGFLAGSLGISSCFYANGISYFAVIAALVFIKGDFSAKDSSHATVVERMIDGAKYVWTNKNIRSLVAITAISSIFGMANIVLMPIFARDILKVGMKGLGLLMASIGAGAVLGALMLGAFSHYKGPSFLAGIFQSRRSKGGTISQAEHTGSGFIKIGSIILALSLILFSFSKTFSLSVLLLSAAGWGIIAQAVTVNVLLQLNTPDKLRGRVISFYTLMFLGMMPVGSFQAGLVAHWFGAPIALLFSGSMCLILTPLFFRNI